MSMMRLEDLLIKFDKLKPTATILVVEDVEKVRDSARQIIEEMGYQAVSASDEDEAVAQAKQQRPDLILVNQHEPVRLEIAHQHPTVASRISERAQLGDDVLMVTHTDVALTVKEPDRQTVTYNDNHGLKFFVPRRGDPQWRNECFGYSGERRYLKLLLRHWLA
jgi:CheY-like chemotaxis protein